MASKKVSIYHEVKGDEGLLEELKFRGLVLIEVAAEFCGFAKPMEQVTRRLFMDAGDKPVRFSRIIAETSDILKPLHAHSRPYFILAVNGTLVDVFAGINPPKLYEAYNKAVPASLDDCPAQITDFDPATLDRHFISLSPPTVPPEWLEGEPVAQAE